MINFLADKLPTGIKIFGFEIRFYAIFILAGAILAFVLAIYHNKKQGTYDKTTFENLFYIAFPSGILGARLWYVIAEWNKEFAGQDFWKPFRIWEGGLAIHGGVLIGIAVGMLYVHFKRRHVNVLKVADVIVPGILLAQAIGRFGNFFNCEVYGYCIDRSSVSFLPNFIVEQLKYNELGGLACDAGQVTLPLFLIEGVVNVIGYFVIMYAVRYGFKRVRKDGDMIGCYFIWYGIVRAILEPLRHKKFQMGDNLTSVWMSIAFVIIGIAIIILCHVYSKKITRHYELEVEKFNTKKIINPELKEDVILHDEIVESIEENKDE